MHLRLWPGKDEYRHHESATCMVCAVMREQSKANHPAGRNWFPAGPPEPVETDG